METIALTGGIGCGKTEATKIFASLGVPIVDLDVISHQLTSKNQPLVKQIADTFGHEYMTKDGALNRAKMRGLVFKNDQAREQLSAILHPAIYDQAIIELQSHKNAAYTILAIPLLDHDSIYYSIIDRILVVDCDENIQIDRVMARSKLEESEVKAIINSQTPRETRIEMADDLIENNGNIEDLHQKINKLHQKYIKTCIVSKTIS